ncbi:MAG: DUF2752 domain-containing protein [Bacteroidetes bacterium]|nr:MAG: DUF2752 domain-containing protein [Bacteroidota bacterium]
MWIETRSVHRSTSTVHFVKERSLLPSSVSLPKTREFWFWLVALVALAIFPFGGEESLCVLSAVGIESCPGCGLGTAIHYLFHLDVSSSWKAHPMAIPVVFGLLFRIVQLYLSTITYHHESNPKTHSRS